jgi:hypothetical protein
MIKIFFPKNSKISQFHTRKTKFPKSICKFLVKKKKNLSKKIHWPWYILSEMNLFCEGCKIVINEHYTIINKHCQFLFLYLRGIIGNWKMWEYLLLLLMVGERRQIGKRVHIAGSIICFFFSLSALGPIHIFARHILVLPIRDFWSWHAHLRPENNEWWSERERIMLEGLEHHKTLNWVNIWFHLGNNSVGNRLPI